MERRPMSPLVWYLGGVISLAVAMVLCEFLTGSGYGACDAGNDALTRARKKALGDQPPFEPATDDPDVIAFAMHAERSTHLHLMN